MHEWPAGAEVKAPDWLYSAGMRRCTAYYLTSIYNSDQATVLTRLRVSGLTFSNGPCTNEPKQ